MTTKLGWGAKTQKLKLSDHLAREGGRKKARPLKKKYIYTYKCDEHAVEKALIGLNWLEMANRSVPSA